MAKTNENPVDKFVQVDDEISLKVGGGPTDPNMSFDSSHDNLGVRAPSKETSTQSPNEDLVSEGKLAEYMKSMLSGKALGERDAKKVGFCDGTDGTKVLRWLRLLDSVQYPMEIAKITADGPLAAFLKTHSHSNWKTMRSEIAYNFISAAFQQTQRDELEQISQRSGEPLVKFNHEFDVLVKEAYDPLPVDQQGLIRTYLSALSDRELAIDVLDGDKPRTLKEAVRYATQRTRTNDKLKPKSRTAKASAVAPPSEKTDPIMKAVTALVASQKELQEQLADMKQITSRQINQPGWAPVRERKPGDNNCFRCGKSGHYARECMTPDPSNILVCERCRKGGHTASNCRTGPPRGPCFRCGDRHWAYDCPKGKASSSNDNLANTNEQTLNKSLN